MASYRDTLITQACMRRRRGEARTYLPYPLQAQILCPLAGLLPVTLLQPALPCAERKS